MANLLSELAISGFVGHTNSFETVASFLLNELLKLEDGAKDNLTYRN